MKTNGKHETSPAGLRAARRDNKVAAVFAGIHAEGAPPKSTESPFAQIKEVSEMSGDQQRRLRMVMAQVKGLRGEVANGFTKPSAEQWAMLILAHEVERRDTLFDAIKHGDAKHQAWLLSAIEAHFAGLPVPREPALPTQN
jgi:hypothetical protein